MSLKGSYFLNRVVHLPDHRLSEVESQNPHQGRYFSGERVPVLNKDSSDSRLLTNYVLIIPSDKSPDETSQ